MPNGQVAQYDEAGNLIHSFDPQGRPMIMDPKTGSLAISPFKNVGATPPASPQTNIGAVTPPVTVDRGYMPPAGLPQMTAVPVAGPTQSGTTLDTSSKAGGKPAFVPPASVAAMNSFNNRDRSGERQDVGIHGGSGQGQQTMVQNGDPGTVTKIEPRVADATENHINSFMPRQADGSISTPYGTGSASSAADVAQAKAGTTLIDTNFGQPSLLAPPKPVTVAPGVTADAQPLQNAPVTAGSVTATLPAGSPVPPPTKVGNGTDGPTVGGTPPTPTAPVPAVSFMPAQPGQSAGTTAMAPAKKPEDDEAGNIQASPFPVAPGLSLTPPATASWMK